MHVLTKGGRDKVLGFCNYGFKQSEPMLVQLNIDLYKLTTEGEIGVQTKIACPHAQGNISRNLVI